MRHVVGLNRLPDGLQFPADLAARISYSVERRQLQFEGFMSKTDFDKLVRLSNDLAYQRSLEQLFQVCTFAAESPAASKSLQPLFVSGLVAAGVAASVLMGWFAWRAMDRGNSHGSHPPMEVHAASVTPASSSSPTLTSHRSTGDESQELQFVSRPAQSTAKP